MAALTHEQSLIILRKFIWQEYKNPVFIKKENISFFFRVNDCGSLLISCPKEMSKSVTQKTFPKMVWRKKIPLNCPICGLAWIRNHTPQIINAKNYDITFIKKIKN